MRSCGEACHTVDVWSPGRQTRLRCPWNLPPGPGASGHASPWAPSLVAAPWSGSCFATWAPDMDAVAVLLPLIGSAALLVLAAVAALRRHLAARCSSACRSSSWPSSPPSARASRRAKRRIASADHARDRQRLRPESDPRRGRRRRWTPAASTCWPPWRWGRASGTAFRAHDGLPYRVAVGQLGVRSRWPLRLLPPNGPTRSRLLRDRAWSDPGDPFVLYVAHALNPLHDLSTFADQRDFARLVIAAAGTERLPVVWSGTSTRPTGRRATGCWRPPCATRCARARVLHRPTTAGGGRTLFLRIDHAFVPIDWCAANGSTFAVPGSDHHGIQVTVGPCA